MIKAILFDVDGLVIIGEKRLFSKRYSDDHGVSEEEMSEFFTGVFRECSFGRADLKEELVPYLRKWKWDGTVDDFLRYWFETESELDMDVIDIVQSLREKGIKCYLATRQEKYRASYFMNTLNLKKYFDGMFCSCDIGYDKNQPEFWDEVVKRLSNIRPDEIMFFDDSQKNIDFTSEYGINAYFYSGIKVLKDKVEGL